MNQLSWFLYLGDVSESVSTLFVVIFVLFGSLAMASLVCAGISYAEHDGATARLAGKWSIVFVSICLVFAVFACALPSKNTVYAIAASQMGEEALKTPLGTKASQILEAWLDKQIKGNK